MTKKFETHKYWKHRGDCCDFLEILEIIEDTGDRAEIKVAWHTQSNKSWRTLVRKDQFRVTTKDYHGWQAYSPRGWFNEN